MTANDRWPLDGKWVRRDGLVKGNNPLY